MPRKLGYPKLIRVTPRVPQPQPFRFKIVRVGPVIHPIFDAITDHEQSGGLDPEVMIINGREVRSRIEWYLYKALLRGGISKEAIEYQVQWNGGRALGGQVLDFVIYTGVGKIALRPMGAYWHPGDFGTELDAYTFAQLQLDGYTVYDIAEEDVSSVDVALDTLRRLRIV